MPKYYVEGFESDQTPQDETGTGLSWSIPPDMPTYEPPVRDRTDLDARLAKLSPSDKALFDHYEQATGHDRLREGNWILAAPMTVDEARMRLLGPNPRRATDADIDTRGDVSTYSLLQVGDGVVAFDDFEYRCADLNEIPAEVRDLAALVLDGPDVDDVEVADWFAVAMAMCEKLTGVRATRAVRDVSDRYVVPMLWGVEEDGGK